MKVGITGATGFIARHLIPTLRERGHEPVAFSRSPGQPVAGCVETRPLSLAAPPDVSGLDAVINAAAARSSDGAQARAVDRDGITSAIDAMPLGPSSSKKAACTFMIGTTDATTSITPWQKLT